MDYGTSALEGKSSVRVHMVQTFYHLNGYLQSVRVCSGFYQLYFLPGMLLWGMLFRGWARAHAQHDCAEFVAFVAARLCPQVFEGDWMARRSEEHRGVVTLDTHTCEEAISVDLPPGDRLRAQFLIHEWHSQAVGTRPQATATHFDFALCPVHRRPFRCC